MRAVLHLFLSTQDGWRKLDGVYHLAELVQGVKFVDEIRENGASLGSCKRFDINLMNLVLSYLFFSILD